MSSIKHMMPYVINQSYVLKCNEGVMTMSSSRKTEIDS